MCMYGMFFRSKKRGDARRRGGRVENVNVEGRGKRGQKINLRLS